MWGLVRTVGGWILRNPFKSVIGGGTAYAFREEIADAAVDATRSIISDPLGSIDSAKDGISDTLDSVGGFIDGTRSTVEGGVDLVRDPAGALTETFTGAGAGASAGSDNDGMGISGWAIAAIGAFMALKNFTGGEGFSISNLLTIGATVFGSQHGGKLDNLVGGLADKAGLSDMFNSVAGMLGFGGDKPAVTTGNRNLPSGLRLTDPRGATPALSGPTLDQ